jgi:glycosyltransferase involved in cell wall biosynthesis
MVMHDSVCIDARMIGASGIGTYLQGLLGILQTRKEMPISVSLLGDSAVLPKGPWSIHEMKVPIYSIREQVQIPRAVDKTGAALLHSPHYNMPLLMTSRTVVTVHDLIHLKFPQFWPSVAARAYARFFFQHVVPKARRILTDSENTKKDLIEMCGIPENRITVIYLAVSHERFRKADSATLAEFKRLGLPKDYLLYVGNLKEFKNVERLLEAYRQLRSIKKDAPAMVWVGRNFITGFDHQLAQTSGITWLGEIRSELLPALYQNALAFLFPSLYEGFGLPPLEAMASGTPVLCSNRGSLPEVVGDAALLVNPESVEDMTMGIKKLVEDSGLRKAMSVKGLEQASRFSWQRMADQTLNIYKECLAAM